MTRRYLIVLALAFCLSLPARAQTKLLRFPDIQGDAVVFSYGGDLWRASAQGGTAVRLTAHPGVELFGKFSPDGKWIAFTGQYDGDEQVYVIPAWGGEPRQLTFYPANGPLAPRWGYDNQVYGWTPDGSKIVFRSMRDSEMAKVIPNLYTVTLDGAMPEKLPMPTSGAGDFAPDGQRLVYSPLFRDFRTWKRYSGGWAQDLYTFDLSNNQTAKIAATPRTERDPMWIGNAVFFVSDRDGTLNLYRYDLQAGTTTQLTSGKSWDVRWASSDNDHQIVYELDGELEVFDTAASQNRHLSISVPDDGLNRRPSRVSAQKQIEDYELSPQGERALFTARGDVFTAPIEKGSTRNLTHTSRVHERLARWSPDGKKIAFVTDQTGEEQLALVNQDGAAKPELLTSSFHARLNAPAWSGDGKRIALSDKDGKVYVVDVASRAVTQVADDDFGGVNDYSWSKDGGFLAFSLQNRNGNNSLYVWSAGDAKLHRVTDDFFNSTQPVWDPKGDYLFFLSDRQFAPQISTIEWNFATSRTTGVYALALRRDVKNPFAPESDEVKVEDEKKDDKADEKTDDEDEKKGKGADKEKDKQPAKPLRIDFEDLARRIVRVPVDADNLDGLAATEDYLLYTVSGAPYYGRDSDRKTDLEIFDRKERETKTLAGEIDGYALSFDGSKVLVKQGASYNLWDAKPKPGDKKTVSTGGLMVDRVPADEWAEMFDEVWRRYRDFFYVRNMHGYDWKAIGERYKTLLPYVAHRSDLNYVIGEMIAELSIGHAYVEGGDFQLPERPKVGLPGARFALDKKAGRYRLAEIYRGENGEEKYRAPLAAVGVDAREGDYVLAIDGQDLRADDNPYRLLRHKTDPVTMTLNTTPSLTGARRVTYEPIFDEYNLRYLRWVEKNRAYVAEKTGGRVGYIHIPDMGGNGAYEFIKSYYPQIRKEGLVVDVRANGGGNISQWIIERLDSKLLGTRFGYASDYPSTYPNTVFYGHMVCLLNQVSASDGDIFPHRFRDAGLGPLIGKRSWGGVVGISGTGPLLDGGTIFVPQQATNDVDGSYIIEGHGVDPDIDVENEPAALLAGHDQQLDRGIEEVLKAMEREPRQLPKRPADPVKTP
jgi:tricorn protease